MINFFNITERQTNCYYNTEDKWHCGDGLCVLIDERCDGNLDCINGNDEMNCCKLARLYIPKYYVYCSYILYF